MSLKGPKTCPLPKIYQVLFIQTAFALSSDHLGAMAGTWTNHICRQNRLQEEPISRHATAQNEPCPQPCWDLVLQMLELVSLLHLNPQLTLSICFSIIRFFFLFRMFSNAIVSLNLWRLLSPRCLIIMCIYPHYILMTLLILELPTSLLNISEH